MLFTGVTGLRSILALSMLLSSSTSLSYSAPGSVCRINCRPRVSALWASRNCITSAEKTAAATTTDTIATTVLNTEASAATSPSGAAAVANGADAAASDDAETRRAQLVAKSLAAAAKYDQLQRRNVLTAGGSALAGAGVFAFQRFGNKPLLGNSNSGSGNGGKDPLALLRSMEADSMPLAVALANGKPTVIDFYAGWCENCKAMAPRLASLEEQYRGQINFVTLDADTPEGRNDALVSLFRVDGIPHLALVSAQGNVETALIGLVPKEVLKADLNALASKDFTAGTLPYLGYDAFDDKSGRDRNVAHTFAMAAEIAAKQQAQQQ